MSKIIIGQECICPDGLGRVAEFGIGKYYHIKVDTYINNRGCHWDSQNVKLLPIHCIADSAVQAQDHINQIHKQAEKHHKQLAYFLSVIKNIANEEIPGDCEEPCDYASDVLEDWYDKH